MITSVLPHIFFLLLLLTACSSLKDKKFVQHRDIESKDFVAEFESSSQIINNFRSKKVAKPVEKKALKKSISKKDIASKAIKKPKKKIRVVKSKIIPTQPIKKTIKEMTPKRKVASIIENEYSDTFRSYDDEYEKALDVFSPIVNIGEEFVFEVSFFGVTAGYIRLSTEEEKIVNDKLSYHFRANMRSARFYSTFYQLDDSLDSYVIKESFLPHKYTLTQRETAQNVDDLQIFDHEERETHVFYKRIKRGVKKAFQKTIPIPRLFQDSYSAIHFVRGLPLREGDYYEFPVITRGKVWILKAWVDKSEFIEIMDEDVRALKLRVETHFPGVLAKKGNIFFWFSDDDDKKLLRFDAKVKIGTITGELVEYKSGER